MHANVLIRNTVPTVNSAMFKLAQHMWHIAASGNNISYAVAGYAPHKWLPNRAGRPCKASRVRPEALRMAAMHTYIDGSQPGISLLPCASKKLRPLVLEVGVPI